MGRLDAALRVVQRFNRRRIFAKQRNFVVFGEVRVPPVAVISEMTVENGKIRLIGNTNAKIISFATELGFVSVSPVDESGSFEVEVDGATQLVLRVNGQPQQYTVRTQTPAQALRNGLSSALALTGFLKHWRDIWSYMVQGDSIAGDRLEILLDPPTGNLPIPIAHPRLFDGPPAPQAPLDPMDIVVPVFNAFDDTKLCLEHLARHTDDMHRVHLIEDCSTDGRILPLLEEWVSRRQNALLTINTENRGFIASVNTGFGQARGHVVLLNTDAFVPTQWLERLMQPILLDTSVASVTPMSSDAEILTAPVECVRFEPSDGQAEAMDRVARRLSPMAASADLPTGVGYCMALNRSWLEKEPEFDPVFGRGYGEEVDWCRKVAAKGGRHVGIGNLYVEHRGGGSFRGEKPERLRANNRRIESLYPGYDELVSTFRKTDPLVAPRLALAIASIDMDAPVPVYMAQRIGGGSEAWLNQQIQDHLAVGQGVIVIGDDAKMGLGLIEVHTPSGITRGAVQFEELAQYLSVAERLWINYSCLVTAKAPLDFLETCRALIREGDSLTVYFHDFFPICPSYNLVSADGSYCGLPEAHECQRCYNRLAQTSGQRPLRISEWRQAWEKFLGRAEELVAFGEDSAAMLRRVWPNFDPKIRIRPHTPVAVPRRIAARDKTLPVVGVLGNIGYNKGAAVLRGLAEESRGLFRIVVLGKLDPAYRHKNIEVHGGYNQDQISDLAETYGVSAWLVPSIWPETFCFAAHECLATGLPVLSFDIGAHGDAIRSHPNGTVFPLSTSPVDIAKYVLAAASQVQ